METERVLDNHFDVIVASPNAALDSYYIVSELTLGSVNRAERSLHTAGGKGINLSRAVVAMGGKVLSLGIVGGLTGKFIASELEREKIPSDMVWSLSETRRSSTFISSDQMQVTVILDSGSSVEPVAGDELVKKVQQYASKTPFLVLTGSLPPSLPPCYYAQIVQQVREVEGLKVCMDCSGEALRSAVDAGAQIVKVNLKEFQDSYLAKNSQRDLQEIRNTFTGLARGGLELLIITDGPHGAYVFPAGKEPFQVVTQVEKWVNTAGAGDTFLGGLVLGINRGLSIEEATCYASAAASAKLQQIVCGSLNLEDLNDFLPLTRLEKLF